MIGFGLFFAILGQKSGTASTKDARRRLQLLWVSSAIGFTPSLLVTLYSLISGKDWGYDVPDWALFLVILGFAVFPLTLAYVVVVHRAMDVSMVMRQSMQYALAKNGLSVLRAILVLVALTVSLDPHKTVGNQAAGLALAGVAFLALRGKFSDKASQWMDRKFFREAYSSEHILSHLSGEVRKYSDTKPLLETVTSRISDTLHVPRIAVLLANGDSYAGGGAEFGTESKTMEYLRTADKPAVVYFDDPDSWVHQVEPHGQQTLKSLDAQLLLPLTGRDKLMGLISLGPKLSEVPYSNSDVKLLQSVASQMGLAIENNQLVSKLASEAAIQERMNRELEIAREVQQRLFPQKFPTIGGLDSCGKCRAALGVGGDYYDFLLLPDGKLGIAIGDVSGKGISAALLMASLRSSLRGQTIGGCNDLAGLMTNMNHLVYAASASNRYATFFYGQYDPATRRLDLVNVGHNAPVILRGQEVLLLEAGGPVVGLLPRTVYQQMSIQLEPGDVFLGYTDGISEAMNKADEEWGEDQMIATAKANANLGSSELIDQIMIQADAFADGAEQHDDMTLLIMKIA